MTMPASTRTSLSYALLHGVRGGFRHWRVIVIAWLAGLVAATLAAWPVFGLFNRALGANPDAARIVTGQNIAPVVESVLTLGDGARTQGIAAIGQGMSMALAVALLLTPWLGGMLVASLREGRALRFGELWLGGWREYGRQWRLLLVALIPWGVVGVVAFIGAIWMRHGQDTRILESISKERTMMLMGFVGVAALLAWSSIEAARAAFAADPTLRSAMRAWLRGLRLLLKRPVAVVLLVIVTTLVGAGLAMLLQQPALRMPSASSALLWWLAQLAVLALWWSRIVRLSALAAIIELPDAMAIQQTPAFTLRQNPSLPPPPTNATPPADA